MSEPEIEGAHFMWEFRAGMSNAAFVDWLTRRENEQRAIGAERALRDAAKAMECPPWYRTNDAKIKAQGGLTHVEGCHPCSTAKWLRDRAATVRQETS